MELEGHQQLKEAAALICGAVGFNLLKQVHQTRERNTKEEVRHPHKNTDIYKTTKSLKAGHCLDEGPL